MIILPTQSQWVQRNRSDMFGDLLGSFNLDLTKNLGKLRVTKMLQTTSQTSDTDMTAVPVGFKVFNDGTSTKIWTVAGSYVHSSASAIANAAFISDHGVTSGSPTDCDSTKSDIEIMSVSGTPTLFVTANQKLYKRTTGAWSSQSFSGDGPWPMTNYSGTARLYFGVANGKVFSTADGTTIASSSTYTLNLGANYFITFLRASSNRIWVGTVNTYGGKGYIFEWDGTTANPTTSYRMEAQGALACVIKDDLPWVVDSNGRLLQFSNATFSEVARLPIDNKLLLKATNSVNDRFIHPNGMTLVNGKINILINNVIGDSGATINEFCPSGIWEYDDIVYNQYTGLSQGCGLYHKYALSYTPTTTNTITDYGQNRLSVVGALSDMKMVNSADNATGNLIAGAKVFTDASSTNVGIFTNDTFDATSGVSGKYNTMGAGYFVTTKQFAIDEKGNYSVQNAWQNVFSLYRKLITSGSSITIKYRTLDIDPVEASITWTSTTTFTTPTNLIGYEGYEVEGIQGKGSGFCAHITQVDVTAGLYTVTVDTVFTGVTGTAKVRVQNWKKISTVSPIPTYDQAGMGDTSNWTQYKVFMVFSGHDELEKLIIINQNILPAH